MKKLFVTMLFIALLCINLVAFARGPGGGGGGGNGPGGGGGGTSLDATEEVHLLYMRAEEKLAHDVYLALGDIFPDHAVFSNIEDSETNHVASMVDKLRDYDLDDPYEDDIPGEFSDENYGSFFEAIYVFRTDVEATREGLLQALKNGALIEELDMHDIVLCPVEIVAQEDEINDETECGMEYTDEKTLINSFENLLEGSKNHLWAFVRQIEANFPDEYPYQAQYLTQDEVNEILGR